MPFPIVPPRPLSYGAATAEQAHGSVTFLPENDELAAEENVEIVYSPPEGLFDAADSLLYCGGFNGWDGEEEGMTMPMMPMADGKFHISINVPNFARVSDLRPGASLQQRQVKWYRCCVVWSDTPEYSSRLEGTCSRPCVAVYFTVFGVWCSVDVPMPTESSCLTEQARRSRCPITTT